MTNEKYIRRSGIKIMASLITLLGSLAYIMILAVINGSVGFIVAMGVTLMGAVGIANMWVAIFADVGVMVLAVLNAIRTLFVKRL